MHLSRDALKRHIAGHGLVSGLHDLDGQLTANGVDVRLAAIVEVLDGGRLAVAKADNRPPKLGKAYVLKGFESRLEGYPVTEKAVLGQGPVKLDRLRPYLAVTCEEVNAPPHLMFHIAPRSSLFRLTQSMLGCAFGEAGYRGFLTFMLLPFADAEIELGSRFAQLSFSELKGEARYEEQAESSYQGGKLF
jgi:deoxycytidine triphosphate deaminase